MTNDTRNNRRFYYQQRNRSRGSSLFLMERLKTHKRKYGDFNASESITQHISRRKERGIENVASRL